MSDKWNRRYRDKVEPGEPCRVLREHLHLLPETGRSLDLACGLGANALLLAERGLESHAWDNAAVALDKLQGFAGERGLTVHTLQRDVEREPPAPAGFQVIVVSQFLFRPLFPALVEALQPGGLLYYQTFHRDKLGDRGPSNPDFLLAPGELLQQLSSLQTLFYREDGRVGDLSTGLRDCSYYIGRKPR